MGNACQSHCQNNQLNHFTPKPQIEESKPQNSYIKSQLVTTNPCSQFVSWNYDDDILIENENKVNLEWNIIIKNGQIRSESNKCSSIINDNVQSSEPNLNSNILYQLNRLGLFQRNPKLDQQLRDIQTQKGTRLLNGDIYVGQVYNGVKWGFGILYEADGSYYEGYFFNNKFHGKGRYISSDGNVEFGEWFDGFLIGRATYIDSDGNLYQIQEDIHDRAQKMLSQNHPDYVTQMGFKFYGSKIQGKREGFGVWLWPDGTKCYGNFVNNNMEGYGVQIKNDIKIYEGQFKNGEYNGIGTLRYEENVVYDGQMSMGKREGYGVLIWDDGKIFRGHFHNDKPFGPGRLVDQYGQIQNGLWSA